MPFQIIRNDLLKIECDAIVNPTDSLLSGSGSLDKKIHESCGIELDKELENYICLDVSQVLLTDSYNLKTCKKIIHVVGPTFIDGSQNEYELLRTCYQNILSLAKENNLDSIAIPLISSGSFRFPKKDAFHIAYEEISHFLYNNDLDISLVVYDDESFSISKELAKDVKDYIEDNFIKTSYSPSNIQPHFNFSSKSEPRIDYASGISAENLSFELDESFSEAILRIIDEKNLKDPDVYKKAGLNKQIFSTLRTNQDYRPSKKTALALCIALELDIKQTNEVLQKAGLSLSHSYLFDIIVEYFIKNRNYDLYDINSALLDNDQPTIGC